MAKYNVNFFFNEVSLSQQDRIYTKLLSVLDDELKEKIQVCITDEAYGEHYLPTNLGKRPDGMVCRDCYEIDCNNCRLWKQLKAGGELNELVE